MRFPNFLRIAVKQISGVCEFGLDQEDRVILLDGSEARFLKLLSEIFHFGYELLQPSDDAWGGLQADGNWSGMMGMIHRGEVDMAMCGIALTHGREEIVDFTIPYDIQQKVFATRLPRPKPKFITFLLPFSTEAWYLVLSLLLIMPLIWRMFLTIKYPLSKLFFYALLGLLRGSANIKGKTFSDYIFLANWFCHAVVFTIGYSAVLLSFVTLPLKEDIVKNIPQLTKAIEAGSWRCMVFRGTTVLPVTKEFGTDKSRILAEAIGHNNWFVEPTYDGVMRAIMEGNTAVIANRPFFQDHFQDGVAVSEDSFLSIRIGLALSKDFCCKKELDRMTQRILYAGFMEKFRHDAWFLGHLVNKEPPDIVFGGRKSLKVEDMVGAFCFLIIGYIISFAVLFAEMFWAEVQKYTLIY